MRTSAGFAVADTVPMQAMGGSIDTLIVAGGEEDALRRAIYEDGAGAWLAQAAQRSRRVASVCTGASARLPAAPRRRFKNREAARRVREPAVVALAGALGGDQSGVRAHPLPDGPAHQRDVGADGHEGVHRLGLVHRDRLVGEGPGARRGVG